jgi:probable rRNA maturation factor
MISAPDSSGYLQFASASLCIPDESELIKWIEKILQLIENKQNNVIIRLVDEAESQALNKQFRGKDRPTNVLSFPSEVPRDIEPDYLGDIVICAPVVEQEARDQNKVLNAHWAHMLVHGLLHLKGYDHLNTLEAEEMESREKQILQAMDFPDPYSD